MNLDWDQLSPEERDARITSLLLGELAPSEAKQLRDTISADPELARACERRERTIGLLREAACRQHPAGEIPVQTERQQDAGGTLAHAAPTRLSDDRRQKLLESFKTAASVPRARRRLHIPSWAIPMSAAAALMGVLIVASGVTGGLSRSKARAQRTRISAAMAGEGFTVFMDEKQAALAKGRADNRTESSLQSRPFQREQGLAESARISAEPRAAVPPPVASTAPKPAIAGSEYFALVQDHDATTPVSLVVNEAMRGDATFSFTDKERDISKVTTAGITVSTGAKAQDNGSVTTVTIQNEGEVANYSIAPAQDFLSVKSLGALPATAPVPAPASSTPDPNGSVYSVNAVGYVNIASTNGYSVIQNPLNQSRQEGMSVNFANPDSTPFRSKVALNTDSLVSAGDNVQASGPRNSTPVLAGAQWFDQSQPQTAAPSLPSIGARFSEVAQADARTSDFDWSGKNDGRIGAQGGTAPSGYFKSPDPAGSRPQSESVKKFEEAGVRGDAFAFDVGGPDISLGRKFNIPSEAPPATATVEFSTPAPAPVAQRVFNASGMTNGLALNYRWDAGSDGALGLSPRDGSASTRSFGEGILNQQQGGGIGGFGGSPVAFGNTLNRTMDRAMNGAGIGQAGGERAGGQISANTWQSHSGVTDLNRNAAVNSPDKDGDSMERKSESLATTRGFFDDNVSRSQLPANSDGKKSLNDSYGLNEFTGTDAPAGVALLKERKTEPMSELKSVTVDSLLPLVEAEKLPPLTDPSGRGTQVVTDLGVDAAGLPITSEVESRRQRRTGVLLGPAAPIRTNPSQPRTAKVPEESAKLATPAPVPQPEVLTRDNAFSTFSLNVSDVSFKLAAASLEKGAMPEVANIRSEEFINAFDYRDPMPVAGAPIAFAWERARYPFAHNRDVVRFSVKTAAQGREASKPLNIVLLLDNSGSMERADRVRIIQESLRTLAAQLKPQDKLSVVTFSRTASLRVDGASGTNAAEVAKQISALTPEGGTNLEDALDLAYRTALRHYVATAVNRVVLLTDGAANLGNVEPKELKAKVENFRKQGIALDCFGIGWEGFNDDLLEQLSRNGDGRYGFVNTPEEAASEFVGQLAGALRVAASDVKMQVEFNPKRVTAYRQVGYAKHQLTKEQFRDNKVDAGEIGAAESGNALYVIETNPNGEGPIATVRARFRVPQTSDYREHEWVVPFGSAVELEQASPSLRLAASASAFSEWLTSSPFAGDVRTDRLLGILSGVPEVYGADSRPKKLEWMIRQAKSISGK